jgi:predicted MFS family arabinose efflux permease
MCLFVIGSAEVMAGPMMPAMGVHFRVPSSSIALLPAAYGLVYGLIALIAGPLSDRFGRKAPLVAGLVGHAAAMFALPQSGHLPMAISLSGFAGCCAAIIQPNALAMVADNSPPDEIGRRIAQVFVGLMTAFVITPLASGWMASALGWQYAYYVLAGLALLCCIGVASRCPASKQASPALSLLSAHGAALRTPGVRAGLATSFLWLGWTAGFGAIVAEVAARSLTLDPASAGVLAGWFGVVVIGGNLCGDALERRWPRAALPMLAGSSAVGVAAFAMPMNSPFLLALLGMPWAFGYGAAGPLHHARLNRLSARWRGTINSYHASLLNLGIFAVSSLYAAATLHVSLGFFCAIVSCICLCGTVFISRTDQRSALPADH